MSFAARITALALALATFAAPADAAVTVGTPAGENCFPFGCLARIQGVGAIYQQAYNAVAFAGPLTINTISLDGVGAPSGARLLDSASYDLSFYLTASPVTALDTDPAANRGTLLADFGSFTLGGALPDTLTLSGTSFTYDPSMGNLLFQVIVTGLTTPAPDQSATFRYTPFGGTDTGRLVVGSTGASALAFGAVTTFDNVRAPGVPEPTTWAMLIGGMGLTGGALRGRRRHAHAMG